MGSYGKGWCQECYTKRAQLWLMKKVDIYNHLTNLENKNNKLNEKLVKKVGLAHVENEIEHTMGKID